MNKRNWLSYQRLTLSSFPTTTVGLFRTRAGLHSHIFPAQQPPDDHTDVTTLKHIFNTQPKGSVHFFAPLGNASWFNSIGVPKDNVTELDWCVLSVPHLSAMNKLTVLSRWGARDVEIKFPAASSGTVSSTIRITATPCQHFTGRFIHDVSNISFLYSFPLSPLYLLRLSNSMLFDLPLISANFCEAADAVKTLAFILFSPRQI